MDLTTSLIWVGFAIMAAGFAEAKNRSRWYWFVWGLLLGPLAAALVVAWPPRTSKNAPRGNQ